MRVVIPFKQKLTVLNIKHNLTNIINYLFIRIKNKMKNIVQRTNNIQLRIKRISLLRIIVSSRITTAKL